MSRFNRSRLRAAINRYNASVRRYNAAVRQANAFIRQNQYVIACTCGYSGALAYRPVCCPSCGADVEWRE